MRFIYSTFLLLLLIFTQSLPAQTEWQRFLGGSGYDSGKKIIRGSDGNMIVVAEVSSTDGMGEGNSGNTDLSIFKYSQQGDILWQTLIGGSGNEDFGDIIPTSDGGYAIMGTTDSESGEIHTEGGQMDLFIVKLNGFGQKEWTKAYGGTGNDRGFTLIEMYDKGFLIGGEAGSRNGDMRMQPFGGLDGWIARIDKTGKLIWERRFGGGGVDRVNNIIGLGVTDLTYRFLVVATTNSTDNHLNKNLGKQDIWAFNIDEYGKFTGWQNNFGGEADEDIHVARLDTRDSTIVISGTTFSSNQDIPKQQGMGDIWICKFDVKQGKVIFSQTFGGSKQDGCEDVLFTADGGYLLTGMTQSRDGDIPQNAGYYEGVVIKTDAMGQKKWVKTAGYEKKDFLFYSVESPNGGYISVGLSELTNNGIQIVEHNGKWDIWICKFTEPGKEAPVSITPPTITGVMIDKITRKPIKAYLKLTNLETLDSMQAVSTRPDDGSYMMIMPTKGKVSIGTLKPRYFYFGEDFDLTQISSQPNTLIKRNIELEPIKVGQTIILSNIRFNQAEATPTRESYSELERLVTFMKLNPSLVIALEGYCSYESDGVDKANLSLNRANTVKSYLTSHGIREARVQATGNNVNKQLYMEKDEAHQAKNRRVEMTITAF